MAQSKGVFSKRFWLKSLKRLLIVVLLCFISFWVLDKLFPLPIDDFEQRNFAQLVVDSEGKPLRAFPDSQGVWRYPVTLDDVSPLYIEALVNYEDRYFYQHPGVNPFALMRAAAQAIYHGEIVSGGSTLTMQVARILEPHEKTIGGKLHQMFRALQLEWHYSKDDILTYYLNYAPFGGTIEGVEAASFTYLGKSSKDITASEAAMLAVLPQAPSWNRPDLYPERAKVQRNKLLERLAEFEVWSVDLIDEIKQEDVWAEYNTQPVLAPLLSRELMTRYPDQRLIKTAIDRNLQTELELSVSDYIRDKEDGLSAAVIVMDNATSMPLAYIGSADFANPDRAGYVDMTKATRSPGSTLKPFIYGLALDKGLIHSESLLFDVPQSFEGYKPKNFSEHFNGAVSVSQALGRSLNMPAVQVLNEVTPEYFYTQLTNAGLKLSLPQSASPNLSLALGGGGATLQQLVGTFSAVGNGGEATELRLHNEQPQKKLPLLSQQASWIVQDILRQIPLNNHLRNQYLQPSRQIAYKTGTSYGSRDAWVLASNQKVTIGVWVGMPDGSFSINNSGRTTAVPLLERILKTMPNDWLKPIERPAKVTMADICWPLGTLASLQSDENCHKKRSAYLIDDTAPATFSDPLSSDWHNGLVKVQLDAATGKRVNNQCFDGSVDIKEVALWPKSLEPWIAKPFRSDSLLPEYAESCQVNVSSNKLRIVGLDPEAVIYAEPQKQKLPEVQLRAEGISGEPYWFLNGRLLESQLESEHQIALKDLTRGRYEVIVVDETGAFSELNFSVEH
ncbi:penicillin-binding protein 1C [Kangiella koreensis]|uniref:peptidoglycan glycosyltransferase n=1 Tax=Kangiella koreensis (strain DSM 16069 / JCM 12317 / KCTC 12182 / SW-125) TaxID=523791 RepID=C7RB43_KANKD|nr:penicillin-binding protein 1C [Kangiella koreensis]ACV26485.1 penicillin-binding protein 1C [Kangiella koreensis DSM 16069]